MAEPIAFDLASSTDTGGQQTTSEAVNDDSAKLPIVIASHTGTENNKKKASYVSSVKRHWKEKKRSTDDCGNGNSNSNGNVGKKNPPPATAEAKRLAARIRQRRCRTRKRKKEAMDADTDSATPKSTKEKEDQPTAIIPNRKKKTGHKVTAVPAAPPSASMITNVAVAAPELWTEEQKSSFPYIPLISCPENVTKRPTEEPSTIDQRCAENSSSGSVPPLSQLKDDGDNYNNEDSLSLSGSDNPSIGVMKDGHGGGGDIVRRKDSKSTRDLRAEARSYRMIEELKAFRKIHGHCNVPQKNGALGMWVNKIRQVKKESDEKGYFTTDLLNSEIAVILDILGFEWSLVRSWEDHYELLKKFKEQEGHCDYPTRTMDKPLGRWVSSQRGHYKRFYSKDPDVRSSALITQERIDKLNEIGFDWSVSRESGGKKISASSTSSGGSPRRKRKQTSSKMDHAIAADHDPLESKDSIRRDKKQKAQTSSSNSSTNIGQALATGKLAENREESGNVAETETFDMRRDHHGLDAETGDMGRDHPDSDAETNDTGRDHHGLDAEADNMPYPDAVAKIRNAFNALRRDKTVPTIRDTILTLRRGVGMGSHAD